MILLVAFNGSKPSQKAVDLAIRRAGILNATIHVVYSMSEGTQEQMKEIDEAEAELQAVKKQIDDAAIPCESHLLIRGMEPWQDIIEYASDRKVDEIIIGLKKRSRVGKLLFGSNAQHIILEAPCPVVTTR